VIVYDNFTTPTPPWLRGLPHRHAIDQHSLRSEFGKHGFVAATAIPADRFHRQLFLQTPRWTWPAVAVVSAVLDLLAARVLPPLLARHVAFHFVRR
jgi:hypothetical protein